MDSPVPPARLGLLGFGEAGQALARGWHTEPAKLDIHAYDIKTDDPQRAAAKWDDYRFEQVAGYDFAAAALAGVPVVFSLVTAASTLDAADAAAAAMDPGALYFDGNSVAPDTKREAAKRLEAAGIFYVDCAIMAPVHPKLHKVPMLLSGPHAGDARSVTEALGMQARVVPGAVGRASSIKMLRSVLVKGIEALTLEALLAARKAGVDAEVIASLDASMRDWNWSERAAYNLERSTTHGIRRAAEMAEVARTLDGLGLPSRMTRATRAWQEEVGALGLPPGPADHEARADAILAALRPRPAAAPKQNTRTGETE